MKGLDVLREKALISLHIHKTVKTYTLSITTSHFYYISVGLPIFGLGRKIDHHKIWDCL